MANDLIKKPIVSGPYAIGQGSDRVVPKREDLNRMWQHLFNIQGNGIHIDYSEGTAGGQIIFTVPEEIGCPGPFFPQADHASGAIDDRLIIGGCPDAFTTYTGGYDEIPGRTTTRPGILMVGGLIQTFTTPEYVAIDTGTFGAVPAGTRVTKLLTIWADDGAALGRTTFYDYEFIALADINSYPDWTSGNKVYFPLGWVTVYNNNEDSADIFLQVTSISFPNTTWILEGGSGGGGTTIIPAKLTSAMTGTTGTCSLFANGWDASATATGITVRARVGAAWEAPSGEEFECCLQTWNVGGTPTSQYTWVSPPRFMGS